jgi:peptidoglycan L-alanyl-D-glutamate endopeptidase CwlK
MGKDLSELTDYFRPLAQALLDGCSAIGVPVRVVDTGRTAAEQEAKLAQGVSWVPRSKHEIGEAIDIVPLSILSENKPDWDPSHPDWNRIGQVGVTLGLRWGGSWTQHRDPSHFEYVKPS